MLQRILQAWLVAGCLGVVPAVATAAIGTAPVVATTGNIYVLAKGTNSVIAGDARDQGHEGWIDVSKLDWDVTAESSWITGGGASVGKPKPGAVKLTFATGPWSREFLRLITTGTGLTSIVIDNIASDGRPLYRVELKSFLVTRFRIGSAVAASPEDVVEGVFRNIHWDVYTVGTDGRITTTSLDWDVTTGTVR